MAPARNSVPDAGPDVKNGGMATHLATFLMMLVDFRGAQGAPTGPMGPMNSMGPHRSAHGAHGVPWAPGPWAPN